MNPPILMIHGAFCGGWCFDTFRKPFEEAGRLVAAPDLPGHGEQARESVAGLSLADYARAVVRAIDACPEPPVLVGHSMGGLVVQLAAARRPVAGLILLAPSPAWGQTMASAFDLCAGFALAATTGPYWLQAVHPDYGAARAMTLERLPEAQARAAFSRMGPESGRALFEVLNWWLDPTMAASVPALRTPALVISGAADQVHPPAAVAPTALRLHATPRVVPGLGHWTMDEPASGAVVDACLEWLAALTAPAPA